MLLVCLIVHDCSVADDLVVLWQSLAERAKGRADLLKNVTEKEQWIVDLERELMEVREAAAAEKKWLEDELAEEKRKAVEATAQFNTMATGRSNFCVRDPFEEKVTNCVLIVVSCRLS
jgi:septal ring factor EnvC (AmiA/AmiB activator)